MTSASLESGGFWKHKQARFQAVDDLVSSGRSNGIEKPERKISVELVFWLAGHDIQDGSVCQERKQWDNGPRTGAVAAEETKRS
jgi:hypothetical protein